MVILVDVSGDGRVINSNHWTLCHTWQCRDAPCQSLLSQWAAWQLVTRVTPSYRSRGEETPLTVCSGQHWRPSSLNTLGDFKSTHCSQQFWFIGPLVPFKVQFSTLLPNWWSKHHFSLLLNCFFRLYLVSSPSETPVIWCWILNMFYK